MWILCLAEDSGEISSLIFSEEQWRNIYECRLLQLWLAAAVVIGALGVESNRALFFKDINHLQFYVLFNSTSLKAQWWEVDNGRLSAMDPHLQLKIFQPVAGIKPGPLNQ